MNLTLFFRLILMSIFQGSSTLLKSYNGKTLSYDNYYFFCPCIYTMDGFSVSLQINNGNYCESNNGYRTLGDTMISVEFGFPSENEPLMFEYSEMWDDADELQTAFNVTNTVGRIPISVMEEVFTKHGGIDWEKTISIEAFNRQVKKG